MKKIFVTGATGFLGSHLLEHLINEDCVINAIYRNQSKLDALYKEVPALKNTSKINWIKGDLFDENWNLKDIDVVYHLAGFVGYKESDRKQMEKVNVQGTQKVIDKIINEKEKRPKLIYLSSVVAIGAGFEKDQILNENSEFNLSVYNLGYFETKKKAEELVFSSAKEHNFFAAALNPSTIYGPRDMNKSSRKAQLTMAKGQLKFYPEGGVSVVHVDDVCRALLIAPDKCRDGERYILSGDNITIYDLLAKIAELSGVNKPKYKISKPVLLLLGHIGRLLGQIGIKTGLSLEKLRVVTMYHWFDSTKAKNELEFKPTPYGDCIKDSLDWAKGEKLF